MINFLQQKDLKSFFNAPGEDPREFIEKYERLSVSWEDCTKVENFSQYLEGAAWEWLTVLKNDLKNEVIVNDEGIQSNE